MSLLTIYQADVAEGLAEMRAGQAKVESAVAAIGDLLAVERAGHPDGLVPTPAGPVAPPARQPGSLSGDETRVLG